MKLDPPLRFIRIVPCVLTVPEFDTVPPLITAKIPEEKVNVFEFGFKMPPVLMVNDEVGENVTLLNKVIFPEPEIEIALLVNEPAPEREDVESKRKF